MVACEREIYLYSLSGSCLDTYILNSDSPVTAGSSCEENCRFYLGFQDGSIAYMKVTGNCISSVVKIPGASQVIFNKNLPTKIVPIFKIKVNFKGYSNE